ncbi:MAG TPA: ATP phosphoribosyltransferase regulatory subunit, partial [Bryobacteraceae bacterium]|nr:ATP phosphoribosyltransferase regulatory subunit [Bryobacteraceae bacterium]
FAPSEERREIWQCGAELIGESWPLGDLENIAIVRGILEQLGFAETTLRLSHTGIIRAILSTAGYTPEQQLALYDRLIEGDLSVFDEMEARLPHATAPLAMLRDLTGGQVEGLENLHSAFALTLPQVVRPIEELQTIAACLEAVGWPYILDLTIVRGFEYYTGPVFHLLIDGQNVAGGGRYDGLVASQEGQSVPACGFAISVDPLLSLLENPSAEAVAIVKVMPAGQLPAELSAALVAVTALHAAGQPAELIRAGRESTTGWTLRVESREGQARYRLGNGSGSEVEIQSIEQVKQALPKGTGA